MKKSILTIGEFSFQLYLIRYSENEDLFLKPAKLKLWFTFIINISIFYNWPSSVHSDTFLSDTYRF